MATRQIRVGSVAGTSFPTYTIAQVTGPTTLVLDRVWLGPAVTLPYAVFQCYFAVPDDFESFYSVINPTANYRLNHNATQAELDSYDPQRAQSGIAYALAFYDYTQNHAGTVAPTLQVHGGGPAPVSGTASGYSYPVNSIYSIEITTGGTIGTAKFHWQQDTGATSGAAILALSTPMDLSNGVQVYFPAGTYVLGDVFVITCSTDTSSAVPRYEMWPRPIAMPYVYPYIYSCKLPPLTDLAPALPPFISRRGDVILEMALTTLALWPGTDVNPNPYHDVGVSNVHRIASEHLIYELEKKDDDIAIKDLTYQTLPFMGPWRDGSWLQQHAIYGQ